MRTRSIQDTLSLVNSDYCAISIGKLKYFTKLRWLIHVCISIHINGVVAAHHTTREVTHQRTFGCVTHRDFYRNRRMLFAFLGNGENKKNSSAAILIKILCSIKMIYKPTVATGISRL
jgi:hypothetical protein